MIFSQEDAGYGRGQEPTGYAKIEIKDGRGKLSVSVQDLKEEKGVLRYSVYVLRCDEKQVCPICVGNMPLQRSKGELVWGFDPVNVAKTGNRIEQFNIVAVIAQREASYNSSIICPLAAYKDKKIYWKDKVIGLLDEPKVDNKVFKEKTLKKPEINDMQGELGSKIKGFDNINVFDSNKTNVEVEPQDYSNIDDEDKQEIENTPIESETNSNEDTASNDGVTKAYSIDAKKNINSCAINKGESCPQQIGTMGYNPCMNCYVQKMNKNEAEMKRPSMQIKTIEEGMEQLKRYLDKNFEINDPFGSQRRDYKWWKVGNPVYLNNILFQCNIRTPLLFNPLVMMSHFKYRYLIIAIYSDRIRKREYIVCGVPGVYEIDERPFGDMCKWVQLEGGKPKYGAFGYWLVYIDPKTGKFLSLT